MHPPQGVLVAGGLVASVGPVDDTGGAAEIIDLDGGLLLPRYERADSRPGFPIRAEFDLECFVGKRLES